MCGIVNSEGTSANSRKTLPENNFFFATAAGATVSAMIYILPSNIFNFITYGCIFIGGTVIRPYGPKIILVSICFVI